MSHATLIQQAQQLLSNQLLQDLIQERLSWNVEALTRGDPGDPSALVRAAVSWQAIDDLRSHIREQAEKILDTHGAR
jgi:hypothetical protein